MKSVDYSYWATYIKEIHSTLGSKNDIALELASGNCSLSKHLKNEFRLLILSDLSLEMLKLGRKKFDSVCCNMLELPFSKKFDFIFSAFDSINYLNDKNQFQHFFKDIKHNLSDSGYFIFDVALKRNSLKYLKELNRKGKYRGIEYKQTSDFDHKNDLHINSVEIKLNNGKVYKEVHKQRIYDFYYYFEVLESAGMFVAECFDAFTFNDASPESERIQFIVKRNV
jgi:ubiquinone/menaquinone biosynthesis C-methylase UbiE